MKNIRIAILHNFIDNIGGAEIVGLTLARELHAPIYTTNIDREKIAAMGFDDVEIHSIGTVPIHAPFRQQLASLRFRMLDLHQQYDCCIIDGDWAMLAAYKNPALWYVHSPIREIWDLYSYVRKNMVSYWKRPLFDVWVHFNRFLNRRGVKRVRAFVCNSKNTQARLKRYLHKEAVVINPPIETDTYRYRSHEGYWLSVNRLINHKRVELQVEAFRAMPNERLVIVGSYEQSEHFTSYAENIIRSLPSNVTLQSFVDVKTLRDLYGGCIGFITTTHDEDFGMTAVEAMAAGKPVIAPNEGGYKESVLDGKTGVLIDDISPDDIVNAVGAIGPVAHTYREACEDRAQTYDTQVFINAIRTIIEKRFG